jgi:hypothetical protein
MRAGGYCIASATCADEHRAAFARYVLRHGPGRTCGRCGPQQQELTPFLEFAS